MRKRELIRLRNCSRMVESSLFATIDLFLGAKIMTLYGVWGDDFHKNNLKLKKKSFYLLHITFSCYCCSIDLERQSENAGL